MSHTTRNLIVLIAGAGIVLGAFLTANHKEPNVNFENESEINKNLATFRSTIYGYYFEYPSDYKLIMDDLGPDRLDPPGVYSTSVFGNDQDIFRVEVLLTTEWSSVGDAEGDQAAMKQAFKDGGIKEVTRLSRQVNLQSKDNPNKKVGDLKPFNFKGGVGYGFTVTDSFDYCFNVEYACASGEALTFPPPYEKFNRGPLAAVYVAHEGNIYRLEFSADALGNQIFSTFGFAD